MLLQTIKNIFKIDFHDNRIYGLDIIRAIAIISVLLGHGSHIISGEPDSFYFHVFTFLDGVFVFFVLSGFLIGQILIYTLENKPVTYKTLLDFWQRRLLRTLPAYYLILLVLTILSLFSLSDFKITDTYKYYFFLQNFDVRHPFFFAEAWTLSIEVWFYICIPLFIYSLKIIFNLKNKTALLLTIVLFILIPTAFRLGRAIAFDNLSFEEIDHYFRKQVVTRVDSVTFGVIGAYVLRYHPGIWFKNKNLFLIMGICLFLYTKYPLLNHGKIYDWVWFYTLQSVSFLLILPFFNEIKTGKGVVFKIITTLSYVSFSIYLINLNLVQVFFLNKIDFGSITGNYLAALKYFLYLTISVFGGILMYKHVELPMMNLRKKESKVLDLPKAII